MSDGRLPDIPETIQGQGWDTCTAGMLVSRIECVACPAARGAEFLIAQAPVAGTPSDPERPQFYFYFESPESPPSLWIDFAWLSGPRAAELSLWETNTACDPLNQASVFDISALLTEPFGQWTSACIPLDSSRELHGLGFRLSTAGRVGIDAIRFGPPCRPER